MSKQRQSNFELLRIVAMLMILVVHFDGAALGLPSFKQPWAVGDWVKTLVESWSIVGVNLFVMISGYFGIRLTERRLTGYICMCLFYSSGIYALWLAFSPDARFSTDEFMQALLVYSHGDLWFVRDYLFLMLLSPLLNAGLNALERRQLNMLMISLAVINCYFGWWCDGIVNPTGYCLMQLISVYILGFRMRNFCLKAIPSLAIWLVGYVLTVTMAAFMPYVKAYAYNSPAVIIASAGIFMMFANLRISSNKINCIARHTFAVYLIHKNPVVWRVLKFDVIEPLYKSSSGSAFMLAISLVTLAVYCACMAIDFARSVNVTYISLIFKKILKKPG